MRVLHVLNHSYPYADGYAIRSYSIVNAQRRDGLQPVVVTSSKHEPAFSRNPEFFEETAYYRTPPRRPRFLPQNAGVIAGLIRQICRIHSQQPVDLIHAHSPSLCGLTAMLFSLRTHIPFVYEVRAFWEDAAVDAKKYAANSLKYRTERSLETCVIRQADGVTTIASYLKQDIEKRRGKRGNVFLVPNGVDAERFRPMMPDQALKQQLCINATDKVIGFIGSFYRFEGLDVLLRALEILKRRGINCKAVLVGGGEMDSEWRRLCEDLALKNVLFTGRIPHSDVLRYYSIMDFCVYPRLKEKITDLVTPLKPLEAMAMGKLVIGSDVAGIRELLDSGKGGLLFPPQNEEELANLLTNIFKDSSQYENVAAAGTQVVQQKYSWSGHAIKYRQIYQAVLPRR